MKNLKILLSTFVFLLSAGFMQDVSAARQTVPLYECECRIEFVWGGFGTSCTPFCLNVFSWSTMPGTEDVTFYDLSENECLQSVKNLTSGLMCRHMINSLYVE